MICSNCEKPFRIKDQPQALVVVQDDVPVARICEGCQGGVLIVKVVIKRDQPKGLFQYDGYQPVASQR